MSNSLCMFDCSEMISYAENVREWMSAHPDNIIAVHCKGGKGRTGTMICVWLIDGGLLESASVGKLQ